MIDPRHAMIPISRQCALLGLNRSSYYFKSTRDDQYNLLLMKLIDEQFTRTPFYGVPRMTAWLQRQGHGVNPKRRWSLSHPGHCKYLYLLKDLIIDCPDQVWGSDITYNRLSHGFVFLVAIMDWYSRFVLAWELFLQHGAPS
jgi:putative transposase